MLKRSLLLVGIGITSIYFLLSQTAPTLVTPLLFTVANLPSGVNTRTGALAYVSDGNSTTDCTTGGGSTKVLCIYNGGWVAAGSGGGTGNPASKVTVTFNTSTMTFTCSSNTINDFVLSTALTANVTASGVASCNSGQFLTFTLCQDVTGGRTFAWPTGFATAVAPSSVASACTKEVFYFDGTNYILLATSVDSGPNFQGSETSISGTPLTGNFFAGGDSANHVFSYINPSGTKSNSVVPQACSNQIVTGIANTGVISCTAIPSGTPATTQSQNDNSTKVATTAYTDLAVANAVAGVNPAIAVLAASTANVTGTYSNGASGIGATFTVTATGAFTLDGVAINTIGQRILLKNQTSGFQNGMYTATIVGTTGISPVFTRALDYDTPSDINSTGAIPVQSGTVNSTTSWLLTSTVNTVGTDALVYVQFSVAPTTILTGTPTNHGVAIGTATQNNNYTGAGTAGQVLTSNGPSSDPTFQTGGGSNPVTCYTNSTQTCFEDTFSTQSAGSTNYSGTSIGWSAEAFPSSNWNSLSGTAIVLGHPGIIRGATSAGSASYLFLSSLFDPTEIFDATWVVRETSSVPDVLNTNVTIGIASGFTSDTPTYGFILQTINTGTAANWKLIACNTTCGDTTDTGVTASTSWIVVELKRVNSTTVGVAINGGNLNCITSSGSAPGACTGTNTISATHMPSSGNGVSPGVRIIRTSGANTENIDMDYFRVIITGLSYTGVQ